MHKGFLLDENLSHESAEYLITLGYSAVSVNELSLNASTDEQLAKFAKQRKLVIVTLDTDFAEMYHFASNKKIGVILLRVNNQTVESVNDTLFRLHENNILTQSYLDKALVIIDDNKIRIRK